MVLNKIPTPEPIGEVEAAVPADRDNNTDALSKYIVLKGVYRLHVQKLSIRRR